MLAQHPGSVTNDSLLLTAIATARESAFPAIPQTLVPRRLQNDCQEICASSLGCITGGESRAERTQFFYNRQ